MLALLSGLLLTLVSCTDIILPPVNITQEHDPLGFIWIKGVNCSAEAYRTIALEL